MNGELSLACPECRSFSAAHDRERKAGERSVASLLNAGLVETRGRGRARGLLLTTLGDDYARSLAPTRRVDQSWAELELVATTEEIFSKNKNFCGYVLEFDVLGVDPAKDELNGNLRRLLDFEDVVLPLLGRGFLFQSRRTPEAGSAIGPRKLAAKRSPQANRAQLASRRSMTGPQAENMRPISYERWSCGSSGNRRRRMSSGFPKQRGVAGVPGRPAVSEWDTCEIVTVKIPPSPVCPACGHGQYIPVRGKISSDGSRSSRRICGKCGGKYIVITEILPGSGKTALATSYDSSVERESKSGSRGRKA